MTAWLLHETLLETAHSSPENPLLIHDKEGITTASQFVVEVGAITQQLLALGIEADDRVAVLLPKTTACAISFYAVSAAGAVFVPVNPALKPQQVEHILQDCNVKVLLTSPERSALLTAVLGRCPSLKHLLMTSKPPENFMCPVESSLLANGGIDAYASLSARRRVDNDMAAILYTSGSTGRPKGVIISHRNIVDGARSVSTYLEMTARDRVLAVLPFSFDYGLNQLTACVLRGATCVLFDYLLPRDVLKALERHRITGFAAVPPLWAQLAPLEWPTTVAQHLRYITNSGGVMPETTLRVLRQKLPQTRPYLMYGLTEAFRSTYLPPENIDERPGSMGRAIPNAEIMVVRADGTRAAANEPGELVHRGALVALGYWNDPARTAARFKPAPGQPEGIPTPELAVWSGDTVRMDKDGYLYFVGRTDGMIKTSGYRVSPEEIEEIVYANGGVETAAAIGVPHPTLGQAIVLVVRPVAGAEVNESDLGAACRAALPNYMVPGKIVFLDEMPQNPNGKINRTELAHRYADCFTNKT